MLIGIGVVVAVEKKMNKHNTVGEMSPPHTHTHGYIQGTVKNQGRDGEPIHISGRKWSLLVLWGPERTFQGI